MMSFFFEKEREEMGAAKQMRLVALVSAVVASTAVMLRLSGLGVLSFTSSEVPRMYGSLLSWLVPPYVYIIINGIILAIAVSSGLHKFVTEEVHPAPNITTTTTMELTTAAEYVVEKVDAEESQGVGVTVVVGDEVLKEEKEKEFVWERREEESGDILTGYSLAEEKPLVSSRFGNHHRKTVKASPPPDGKALGVAPRSKRNDTLESTWRTITDGRPVPLARHLKKSDNWDSLHGRVASPVRKTEAFSTERRPTSPGGTFSSAGRIRREPSLGQDDLNRRVEAFIRKFNEEMRLQREESLKQYHQMLNRASQ